MQVINLLVNNSPNSLKMKIIILLLTIIFGGFVFGQETMQEKSIITSETVYEKVDKDAEFPGGINAFRNLYTQYFKPEKLQYTPNRIIKTEVRFIIEIDGTINEITAVGENKKFNKEAARAVSEIKQKWEPAIIDGKPVRQRYKLPLTMSFE